MKKMARDMSIVITIEIDCYTALFKRYRVMNETYLF